MNYVCIDVKKMPSLFDNIRISTAISWASDSHWVFFSIFSSGMSIVKTNILYTYIVIHSCVLWCRETNYYFFSGPVTLNCSHLEYNLSEIWQAQGCQISPRWITICDIYVAIKSPPEVQSSLLPQIKSNLT